MTQPTTNKAAQAVHLLAAISRLGLKAFSSKNRQSLIFLMLNDTLQVIRFNRASLWQMDGKTPNLLGFSGESSVNINSPLVKNLIHIVSNLKDPNIPQILTQESLGDYHKEKGQEASSVVWLPIKANNKLALGLLLERWDGPKWQFDEIEILSFLMQNYGAAWEKFEMRQFSMPSFKTKKPLLYVLLAITCLLFIVHIPLRVVAPCEVVPQNPILITSPLEGIIQEIKVDPGQLVKTGEVLFEYDKKVPLEDVKLAEKQVKIIQAEIDRAIALSSEKKEALADLAVLQLRLKKERNQLDLARYKASKLTVKSPIDGVVIIDNPDQWRGNPVQIGEKVMIVSDPHNSKIRIWIPESDNVELIPEEPIKIILNIHPDTSYEAKLIYISTFVTMSDQNIPSFIAEAEWTTQDPELKLGLRGTAILYGENVTLLYWLMRKPWTFIRHSLGV